MQPSAHFRAKIQSGPGYGYITFPRDTFDAGDTVRVRVTINGRYSESRDISQVDHDYRIVFNREQQASMNLKAGDEVEVEVLRIDAPPQLNDLPTDMLSSLQSRGIAENFKRLPPDEQKALLQQVLESPSPEERAHIIAEITTKLFKEDAELPRGQSL